ncbi:MAG: hypothetical protein ABI855_05210 [Bacteroidota bacterium]
MAAKSKVIIDFSGYQEEELGPVTLIITNSLTTNGLVFPALPVHTGDVVTQNVNYTTILGEPDYHGKAADLAAARLVLETSLKDNGNYINNTVAKGNLVICEQSGYPLAKQKQPVGPLPKSTLKIKSTDNPGEFEYDIEGVENADGFLICLVLATSTESNPHKWEWYWSSKTKGIIRGLESSKRYKAVSVGLGTDPLLTFSDPIERTTQ